MDNVRNFAKITTLIASLCMVSMCSWAATPKLKSISNSFTLSEFKGSGYNFISEVTCGGGPTNVFNPATTIADFSTAPLGNICQYKLNPGGALPDIKFTPSQLGFTISCSGNGCGSGINIIYKLNSSDYVSCQFSPSAADFTGKSITVNYTCQAAPSPVSMSIDNGFISKIPGIDLSNPVFSISVLDANKNLITSVPINKGNTFTVPAQYTTAGKYVQFNCNIGGSQVCNSQPQPLVAQGTVTADVGVWTQMPLQNPTDLIVFPGFKDTISPYVQLGGNNYPLIAGTNYQFANNTLSVAALYKAAGAAVNAYCDSTGCPQNNWTKVADGNAINPVTLSLGYDPNQINSKYITFGIYSDSQCLTPLLTTERSGQASPITYNLWAKNGQLSANYYIGYWDSAQHKYSGPCTGPYSLLQLNNKANAFQPMTINVDSQLQKYPAPPCTPVLLYQYPGSSNWSSADAKGKSAITLAGGMTPMSLPGIQMFLSCTTFAPNTVTNICSTIQDGTPAPGYNTIPATPVAVKDQTKLIMPANCQQAPAKVIPFTLPSGLSLPGIDFSQPPFNMVNIQDPSGKVSPIQAITANPSGGYNVTIPATYAATGYQVAYACDQAAGQSGGTPCSSTYVPVASATSLTFSPNYIGMTLNSGISAPAQVFSGPGIWGAVVANGKVSAYQWTAPTASAAAKLNIPAFYAVMKANVNPYCNQAGTSCLGNISVPVANSVINGGLSITTVHANPSYFLDEGLGGQSNWFGLYLDAQCQQPLTGTTQIVVGQGFNLNFGGNIAASPDTQVYTGYSDPSKSVHGPCSAKAYSLGSIVNPNIGATFDPIQLAPPANVPKGCNAATGGQPAEPAIQYTNFRAGGFLAGFFDPSQPVVLSGDTNKLGLPSSMPTTNGSQRKMFLNCNITSGDLTNVCPPGYQKQAPTYFATTDKVIPPLNCVPINSINVNFTAQRFEGTQAALPVLNQLQPGCKFSSESNGRASQSQLPCTTAPSLKILSRSGAYTINGWSVSQPDLTASKYILTFDVNNLPSDYASGVLMFSVRLSDQHQSSCIMNGRNFTDSSVTQTLDCVPTP